MKRRELIKRAALTAGVLGLGYANSSLANEAREDSTLETKTLISKNHGHALSLSLVQLVELIRQSNADDIVLNIKGKSGHNHQVTLNQDQLLEVVVDGLVKVKSSVVGGHSHVVTVELNIV